MCGYTIAGSQKVTFRMPGSSFRNLVNLPNFIDISPVSSVRARGHTDTQDSDDSKSQTEKHQNFRTVITVCGD